jgi:hypothetical protein
VILSLYSVCPLCHQTLRQSDPLPEGAKLPGSEPRGKKQLPECHTARGSNPAAVDVYSLMTFKSMDQLENERYVPCGSHGVVLYVGKSTV